MTKNIYIIISKFRFSVYLPLIFPLLLTACNTLPASSDAATGQQTATGDTLVKAELKASETSESEAAKQVDAQVEKKPVSLDGDMLFNLLAAEFAGNSGDIDASLGYYREASKSIEDSRIAARTAYIALVRRAL